ncbi:MAG: hypothetical protein HY046_10885 [Acidobacteria bacterium]|nr:hypothetical protein [Acidobacteriota bacterium]
MVRALSSLLVVSVLTTPLLAQELATPPGNGKLAKVNVAGSTRFPEEAVVAAAGLAIGQEISRETMQSAADRLSALGVFKNVRYNFRSQKDHVELVIQVDDVPLVPVFYDNFPWFTDEELNAAIKSVAPLFNGLIPPSGGMLDAGTEAIQKLLPTRKIPGTIQRELIGQINGDGMTKPCESNLRNLWARPILALRLKCFYRSTFVRSTMNAAICVPSLGGRWRVLLVIQTSLWLIRCLY